MKDSQILSVFQEPAPAQSVQGAEKSLVFDVCHMGVVLRAVLFVQLSAAVVVMFSADSFMQWLTRFALVTGVALPATLLWLLTACFLKRVLSRLAPVLQYVVALVLGVLAALYGCGLMYWAGLVFPAPWLASASAGATLSGILVAALVMRAKGRAPADTAARLAELQSRIRPHFLFNTLNSAIALVRAEPSKAETLLEDLSDLFRHALVEGEDSVSLADEIALAQRYLAIEQVRFGERLRVQWALDAEADQAQLPPLLLQPLVENAVLHGVEPSATGADLKISTQRRGAVVVIKVINTVPAGQGAAGYGVALRNVRERLSLMHDVHSQFRSGLHDGVYEVRMEVPL